MQRTSSVLDGRPPGGRRRGELRPIGPVVERTIAELRAWAARGKPRRSPA